MNTNNYCIIMAGGTTTSFWPLTKGMKCKQFIDLLGTGETLVQATFRRFARVCPRENIIVVTTAAMAERVRQQIPGLRPYQVLAEPERRNTAPCVAYAAAIINDINPNANIIVAPSDHAIFNEDLFVSSIEQAIRVADRYDWIVLLGVQPSQPNTKYGYIQFDETPATEDARELHRVVTFTEKPPLEMAVRFIATGEFLWNTGIFVWRLPVLMEAYRRHLPSMAEQFAQVTLDCSPEIINEVYSQMEPISLDFGIMEKAENVYVMNANFGWSDVETWDSLFESVEKDGERNVVASGRVITYDTHNTIFHVPEDVAVVAHGLENYVVASNGKIILIAPRDRQEMTIKYASDLELLLLSEGKH